MTLNTRKIFCGHFYVRSAEISGDGFLSLSLGVDLFSAQLLVGQAGFRKRKIRVGQFQGKNPEQADASKNVPEIRGMSGRATASSESWNNS